MRRAGRRDGNGYGVKMQFAVTHLVLVVDEDALCAVVGKLVTARGHAAVVRDGTGGEVKVRGRGHLVGERWWDVDPTGRQAGQGDGATDKRH